MIQSYILGAYVTSPNLFTWDPQSEESYFQGLKTLEHVRGLELPFWGELHLFDEAWLLKNLDPQWDNALTCIPGLMKAMSENPQFGLASDDPTGRQSALEFMDRARQGVLTLNQNADRLATIAVHLTSSPQKSVPGVSSSTASFQRSLETLKTWDWQGAKLTIEHCDAYLEDHPPEKGFLILEDEISATLEANRNNSENPVGITVNWGRSVLEKRHVDGAVDHIRQAREAGLLCGLMFSGCTDQKTPYGVWKDTHMPPPQVGDNEYYAEHSLMTADEIIRCLQESHFDSLSYLGIKIMLMPEGASLEERIGVNRDTLRLLHKLSQELTS